MAVDPEPAAPAEAPAAPPAEVSAEAPALEPLQELLRGLPAELPIMPLRGVTVFPLAVAPLQVGQPRSLRLLDDVMRDGRVLGLVAQKNPDLENPGPDDCYTVGTVGRIIQLLRQPEGGLMVAV